MNALLIEWQLKVSGRSNSLVMEVVKNLAATPYCTIKHIAEKLGVAFTTAQRAIIKLEELGIVSQRSEGKRGRVYCAKAILDILEEPTKIRENLDGTLQS